MTLKVIDIGPGPHTHALVIGIGGYEHLKGGEGTPLPNLLQYGNLGQLTSPPRSALAIGNALHSQALDWQVPLGTVHLLLSTAPRDPDPSGDGVAFESARRDAIQTAFDAWWDRCNANEENVAFCYIAGHGLEGSYPIVLASDFGKSAGQPWPQAFDVNKTRGALTANRAQTQVFLVDACRVVTTSNVEVPDAAAPPLRPPKLRQPDNCVHELSIMATSRNRKAYGKTKQPSYFAKAFVAGLNGGAAVKEDGEWWITTGKLADRFYRLMDFVGADTDAQRPIPSVRQTFRLARLRSAPPARLQFACRPDEATPLADLAWQQGTMDPEYRPQRSPEAWTVDVKPGLCYVSASFTGREYSDCIMQDVIVEPPLTRERVVVT
jgi:Caspase domain